PASRARWTRAAGWWSTSTTARSPPWSPEISSSRRRESHARGERGPAPDRGDAVPRAPRRAALGAAPRHPWLPGRGAGRLVARAARARGPDPTHGGTGGGDVA